MKINDDQATDTPYTHLYDRLFSNPNPDAGGKDVIEALNSNSLKVVTAYVEPSLAAG